MNILIIIVLLSIAVSLLLYEAFISKRIGFTGVLFFGMGIMFSFSTFGAKGGTIVLSIAFIIMALSFIIMIKARRKIDAQNDDIEEMELKFKIGDHGVSITALNPNGKVKINDEIVDAVVEVGEVAENQPIEVVDINPTYLLVKHSI